MPMIDFNDMSTRVRLFHAKKLENRVRFTKIVFVVIS